MKIQINFIESTTDPAKPGTIHCSYMNSEGDLIAWLNASELKGERSEFEAFGTSLAEALNKELFNVKIAFAERFCKGLNLLEDLFDTEDKAFLHQFLLSSLVLKGHAQYVEQSWIIFRDASLASLKNGKWEFAGWSDADEF